MLFDNISLNAKLTSSNEHTIFPSIMLIIFNRILHLFVHYLIISSSTNLISSQLLMFRYLIMYALAPYSFVSSTLSISSWKKQLNPFMASRMLAPYEYLAGLNQTLSVSWIINKLFSASACHASQIAIVAFMSLCLPYWILNLYCCIASETQNWPCIVSEILFSLLS